MEQGSPHQPSQQEVSPETMQGEDKKLAHKGIFILLCVIVISAVGLGGVLLGKYLYASKTSPVVPSVTPTPRAEALTSTPTSDPTENWKTHTNTEYGFSLKFPLDWRVEQKYLDSSFKSQVFPEKTKYYVELTSATGSVSILILPEGELDAGLENTVEGTTEIAGITVTTYAYQNGLVMFTNFKRKNLPYFRIQVKPKNNEVDHILSTFRFTD